MPEYEFRVFPEHEMSAESLEARRVFEMYGTSIQSAKVQTGIGVVTGALAGSKAGLPGVVIGAAVGAVAGYWKSKAARTRVYAQLDAMGLLKRPRIRYRTTWALHNKKFVFTRLPYAEQTALIIVPILQTHYPAMTDSELTRIGQASQRALITFRKENKDIPLALAVEVILAYYGIGRNAAGEYDLVIAPTPGTHYAPPPIQAPTLPPPPHDTPEDDRTAQPNYWLYAAGAVGLILLARR